MSTWGLLSAGEVSGKRDVLQMLAGSVHGQGAATCPLDPVFSTLLWPASGSLPHGPYKTGVKVTVIPCLRSTSQSSEDFEESPQPQKVSRPPEWMCSEGRSGATLNITMSTGSVASALGAQTRLFPGQ